MSQVAGLQGANSLRREGGRPRARRRAEKVGLDVGGDELHGDLLEGRGAVPGGGPLAGAAPCLACGAAGAEASLVAEGLGAETIGPVAEPFGEAAAGAGDVGHADVLLVVIGLAFEAFGAPVGVGDLVEDGGLGVREHRGGMVFHGWGSGSVGRDRWARCIWREVHRRGRSRWGRGSRGSRCVRGARREHGKRREVLNGEGDGVAAPENPPTTSTSASKRAVPLQATVVKSLGRRRRDRG